MKRRRRDPEPVGRRIALARCISRLSVLELANHVGVSKEQVLAWESSKARVPARLFAILADKLGVDPAWLRTNKGDPPWSKFRGTVWSDS